MAPFTTAVLRLGGGPIPALPVERYSPQSAVPSASTAPPLFSAHGVEVRAVPGTAAVRSHRLPDGALRVRVEGDPGARLRLDVDGVDRWYAQSITGLYADRLVRRHYPWPAGLYQWSPSFLGGMARHLYSRQFQPDRLWQSTVAPLISGGVIELAGPQGGGVRISQLRTNAANTVLADSSMALSGAPED